MGERADMLKAIRDGARIAHEQRLEIERLREALADQIMWWRMVGRWTLRENRHICDLDAVASTCDQAIKKARAALSTQHQIHSGGASAEATEHRIRKEG